MSYGIGQQFKGSFSNAKKKATKRKISFENNYFRPSKIVGYMNNGKPNRPRL
jgi:hypothetical protein